MNPFRPRLLYAPFAWIYAGVLALRHWGYDAGVLKSERGALRTWVLGNITVGGTGKSPHVRLFVRELEAVLGAGAVGVLSRGHGRKSRGFRWVEAGSGPDEVGDEPLMLGRQLPGTPVAVCEDRVAGVARMRADRPGLRWVVLDDALQHRRLRPDVATVLLDATQPVTRDRLLPAGRLRDVRGSLGRADSALLTRASGDVGALVAACGWPGHGPLMATSMVEGAAVPWSDAARAAGPLTRLPNPADRARILAVAGIARPERFMDALATGYQIVRREAYPDHHAFTEAEVKGWVAAFDADALSALITTEKDAARLEPYRRVLAQIPVYHVPLVATWLDAERAQAWIRQTLLDADSRGSGKNEDI